MLKITIISNYSPKHSALKKNYVIRLLLFSFLNEFDHPFLSGLHLYIVYC